MVLHGIAWYCMVLHGIYYIIYYILYIIYHILFFILYVISWDVKIFGSPFLVDFFCVKKRSTKWFFHHFAKVTIRWPTQADNKMSQIHLKSFNGRQWDILQSISGVITTQIEFNLKCLAQCICSKSSGLTFLDNVWFGMFERSLRPVLRVVDSP